MSGRFSQGAAKVVAQAALRPLAQVAGTVNGVAVDRAQLTSGAQQYRSARLHVQTGAETGGASARSVACTVQHSTASGSGYANLLDESGAAIVVTVSAVDSEGRSAPFNLEGANRYLRLSAVTAFTGGTAPTLLSSAVLELCDPVLTQAP